MGDYARLLTKEIKLRKDTPQQIISFIDRKINNGEESNPPDHPFFKTDRWHSVLSKWAYYQDPESYFVKKGDYWCLLLNSDAKWGIREVELFAEWIAPYVVGRKKKEYIGKWTYDGEGNLCSNLYVHRK